MIKKFVRPVIALTGVFAMILTIPVSLYFSEAVINKTKYPVFGVDVSHYQGDINWKELENQGVKFAFIKATEGSGHVDESVKANLKNAAETDIKISCYHFFSFDSSGTTQAENFIKAVNADKINMPPVVDIEYYADKIIHKPTREETEKILTPLLEKLEIYYGVKPVIYSTLPVYLRYLKDDFSDYPLWIRSTRFEPDLMNWKFWQYSDCGILNGYNGDEKCIDFNVYCGTEEEFLSEFS